MPTWFPKRHFEKARNGTPPRMGYIFKREEWWVWEWGNVTAFGKTWDEVVGVFESHRKFHAGEGPT